MTAPGRSAPSQGDVLISNPSPLTGERELCTVSADIYNAAGGPTVLVAEIETGTRRLIHKSNLMTVTTPSPSDVSVTL